MCRCFETIKAVDGELLHVEYHQRRFDKTRAEFFGTKEVIELKEVIKVPSSGTYRVKVLYSKNIEEIIYKEYKDSRVFRDFKLCEVEFDYTYKFEKRDEIDKEKKNFDEVIFLKDGFLTDTSIANIALFIDGIWLTPKNPLLKGTTRDRLIEEGFLKEQNLSKNSLKIAQKFAIMNALVGFKEISEFSIKE